VPLFVSAVLFFALVGIEMRKIRRGKKERRLQAKKVEERRDNGKGDVGVTD
jgi:hypothetical protein